MSIDGGKICCLRNDLAQFVVYYNKPSLTNLVTPYLRRLKTFAFDLGNFGAAAALSLLMLLIGLAASYVVIRATGFFPFGVYLAYIYYASSLPPELLDAARVDGCSEVDVFRRVALPLATPLLGLLAFVSFSANWNNFFGPYVMLSDDTLYNMPVGIYNMLASTSAIQPGFNPNPGSIAFQHADAAMAGLIMVVPVAIVFLFAQRYVISGAFTGSVRPSEQIQALRKKGPAVTQKWCKLFRNCNSPC